MQEVEDGDEELVRNPECTMGGHSDTVIQVEFSDDGGHVISGSQDNTVRVWDVASGRQVQELAGNMFALVEGLSGEHLGHRHVLTAGGADVNTLRIYKVVTEPQRAGDGAAAVPVAFFKAPRRIVSLRCRGGAVCVGCVVGAVCVLSAPFLAV